MAEPSWIKRYSEGIVIGFLATAVWAGIAYLIHEGYSWGPPLFYGLVAASVMVIAYFGFTLTKRIPKQKIVPSLDNIEECIRIWLDNHKVTVKNDPHPDCYFRYRITLDSGCYLTVLRSKSEYTKYVQIYCDLGIKTEQDKKVLEQFSEKEKAQIMFDVKVELARARVGYSGLVDPPENFQLCQRVPIYRTLTEFVFMSLVGNVEAARNLVFLMFIKPKIGAVALPPTSDIPNLELPEISKKRD